MVDHLRNQKREEERCLHAIKEKCIEAYEVADAADNRNRYSRALDVLDRAREDREVSLARLRDLDEEIKEAKGRLRRQLAAPTARPINHSDSGAIKNSDAGAVKNLVAEPTGGAGAPSRPPAAHKAAHK